MKHRKPLLLLAAFLFILLPCFLAAEGSMETIPLDPEVRTGTLPNGLKYYVQQNSTPGERAILRLAINAGSVLEDPDQLGMAHFLEHMAFNGTRDFEENELIRFLQGIGMQFGPDINAHTSFDETVYKLMIPLDDPQNLSTGLHILEEWAFGMSLTEKDIEEERGIILEEWRSGLGASRRMMDAAYPDIMYESLYGKRLPIGTEESIRTSTPDAIRRFYRDWYRPDLMAVVAVGDFDPDQVVREIRERFSPYTNPERARERMEVSVPDHIETLYSIQSDPEASWTAAILFNKFPAEPTRTEEDYRGEIASDLYLRMINNRLSELLDDTDPPFTYSYADFTSLTRSRMFHTMTVLTSESGFYRGYQALLTEEKKIRDHGFTSAELDRARKELTAEMRSAWNNRRNRESVMIAERYVRHFLDRTPAPGLDWQWETFRKYIDLITLEEITDMTSRWLTEENRVIYTMSPEKEGQDPVDPVELSRIHVEVSRTATAPPEEQALQEELISTPPEPGAIVSRTYYDGPEVHEWILNNGARVVLKQTDFKENEILFSAMAPGGLSLAEDEQYLSASFSAHAALQSGAGGYTSRELEKILAGSTAGIEPVMGELSSRMNGSCTREDLEDLFQLVHLYFTDPGRDPVVWQSYMTRLKNSLMNRDSDPMTRYSDLILSLLYQDHLRSRPLTAELVDQIDLDTALDFYRDRFSRTSNFTFFLTGSFDLEEVEDLVELWLGSLPPGSDEDRENWIDRGLRYPEGVIRESMNSGQDPVSYVTLIYPGTWEWSNRETEVIQAVADSLEMILVEEIRERATGTYSPGISVRPARIPVEDYIFLISFSCDPHRTEELISLVQSILTDLKENPPEQRFVDDVIKSRRVYLEEQLNKNQFWLSSMERNYFLDLPRELMTVTDQLAGYYTPEILQDRIRRYLTEENRLEVILYPTE